MRSQGLSKRVKNSHEESRRVKRSQEDGEGSIGVNRGQEEL